MQLATIVCLIFGSVWIYIGIGGSGFLSIGLGVAFLIGALAIEVLSRKRRRKRPDER